ncbi:hypothetical protein NHX12_014640, partial [Muraenolepis orangiensis]
ECVIVGVSLGLWVGAGLSLTQVRSVLKAQTEALSLEKTELYRALLDQLRSLAGQQIRNVASLGGNIVCAYPNSDLNPVLAAGGCRLRVASEGGAREVYLDQDFFLGVGKTVLKAGDVVVSVFLPETRQGEFVRAFRQAPRKENALATVTTGMRVVFEEGRSQVVQDLHLYYGGVGPRTLWASRTCQALIGRPWGEEVLEEAYSVLLEEVVLSPEAPGGKVQFRRSLTLSLLFKFYLEVQQALGHTEVPEDQRSALRPLPRSILPGQQSFQVIHHHTSITSITTPPSPPSLHLHHYTSITKPPSLHLHHLHHYTSITSITTPPSPPSLHLHHLHHYTSITKPPSLHLHHLHHYTSITSITHLHHLHHPHTSITTPPSLRLHHLHHYTSITSITSPPSLHLHHYTSITSITTPPSPPSLHLHHYTSITSITSPPSPHLHHHTSITTPPSLHLHHLHHYTSITTPPSPPSPPSLHLHHYTSITSITTPPSLRLHHLHHYTSITSITSPPSLHLHHLHHYTSITTPPSPPSLHLHHYTSITTPPSPPSPPSLHLHHYASITSITTPPSPPSPHLYHYTSITTPPSLHLHHLHHLHHYASITSITTPPSPPSLHLHHYTSITSITTPPSPPSLHLHHYSSITTPPSPPSLNLHHLHHYTSITSITTPPSLHLNHYASITTPPSLCLHHYTSITSITTPPSLHLHHYTSITSITTPPSLCLHHYTSITSITTPPSLHLHHLHHYTSITSITTPPSLHLHHLHHYTSITSITKPPSPPSLHLHHYTSITTPPSLNLHHLHHYTSITTPPSPPSLHLHHHTSITSITSITTPPSPHLHHLHHYTSITTPPSPHLHHLHHYTSITMPPSLHLHHLHHYTSITSITTPPSPPSLNLHHLHHYTSITSPPSLNLHHLHHYTSITSITTPPSLHLHHHTSITTPPSPPSLHLHHLHLLHHYTSITSPPSLHLHHYTSITSITTPPSAPSLHLHHLHHHTSITTPPSPQSLHLHHLHHYTSITTPPSLHLHHFTSITTPPSLHLHHYTSTPPSPPSLHLHHLHHYASITSITSPPSLHLHHYASITTPPSPPSLPLHHLHHLWIILITTFCEHRKCRQPRASGEASYCDDLPSTQGELFLVLVTSTRPHASILNVDVCAALLVPGVQDVVTCRDIPGKKVSCVGQLICGVLADSRTHAKMGAAAVQVHYQDLPDPVFTVEDAIKRESFFLPAREIKKGDVEKAFQTSDHVHEGEFRLGGQEHFYMETQSMLVVPRLGGAFGGKVTKTSVLASITAVAAWKTGRPVRCVLERGEDMLITGARHPVLGTYKVGFMKDGRITAADVRFYANAGNTADESLLVVEKVLLHMDNAYDIPHLFGRAVACRTHLPSNTAFRGFGVPQAVAVMENLVTDVAMLLARPAHQVREVNMYRGPSLTHYKLRFDPENLWRCWEECKARAGLEVRLEALGRFNLENRWRKRGAALVPIKYGVAFSEPFLNQAAALVHIYKDGSVLVSHGGVELGQGIHTKMQQVVSRELHIASSKIYISETSTSSVPNTNPTAASFGTDANGMAVKDACQKLYKRLEPIRTKNPKESWESWINAAFMEKISLSATGFFRGPDCFMDWEKMEGQPYSYFTYGACYCEVELDCLTGDYRTLRTDIVVDVGRTINPSIDIGQIEGAFLQGLGLYTLEQLVFSSEGVLLSRGPSQYKIPAVCDVPLSFNVYLLPDSHNPHAIYSSKGIGEPVLSLGSAVLFAIKDAVAAARVESGLLGPFPLHSPATPERVCLACATPFSQMVPVSEPGSFKPWALNI